MRYWDSQYITHSIASASFKKLLRNLTRQVQSAEGKRSPTAINSILQNSIGYVPRDTGNCKINSSQGRVGHVWYKQSVS